MMPCKRPAVFSGLSANGYIRPRTQYERLPPRVDPEDGFRKPKDHNTFLLLHSVNHNLFGHRDPKQYISPFYCDW
jgi:hypothetical protein